MDPIILFGKRTASDVHLVIAKLLERFPIVCLCIRRKEMCRCYESSEELAAIEVHLGLVVLSIATLLRAKGAFFSLKDPVEMGLAPPGNEEYLIPSI